MCLYGSGRAKVAATVNEALIEESLATGKPYVECTPEDAQGYINTYYSSFPQLKKWIEQCHEQIKQCGYIYSHFGRKRRLLNVHSKDRGVQGEEIRSGFNAGIQSISSDSLLLGVTEADEEIMASGLSDSMEIIMVVHDSVVALIREDKIDQYNNILFKHIQKDRGASIPGCPVGLSSDSEVGGSVDYSCGKVRKQHPSIGSIEDPEFRKELEEFLERTDLNYWSSVASDKAHPDYGKIKKTKYVAEVLKDLPNVLRVLNRASV